MDPATLGRIKDLEAQIQSLKNENEQQVCLNERSFAYSAGLNAFICSTLQRVQIAKYRERWQKLKENAKRRRGLTKDGALAPEKHKDDAEAGHSD